MKLTLTIAVGSVKLGCTTDCRKKTKDGAVSVWYVCVVAVGDCTKNA